MDLLTRIRQHEARVAVVGAGYVGLPLAVEIARAGFHTTAFDKAEEKVQSILAGKSYIKDVPDAALAPLLAEKRLSASTDPAVLGQADVVIICVPTPLNKTKDPDNSMILAAADLIARRLHLGQLVILESTTFPGFTREVLLPRLEQTGLKAGTEFFLAFSPERVDPGNPRYHTKNTPKVVGGTTPACLEAAMSLYGEVIERLVSVSSTDAAEMVKLLENTFRQINIGLVNEVAIMCQHLGVSTWEVIEAAASKPFGFMPFYPGPGLGGHCIPIDPLYLSWKLKTLRYNARFIELADEINSSMPRVVAGLVADALNGARTAVNGARILVLGVAYKKDIDDVRESPALDIIEELEKRGAHIAYHDPHIPAIELPDGAGKRTMRSVPFSALAEYDCVLIVTDHSAVDYAKVVAEARCVVDTRNATRAVRQGAKARVVSL